MISATLKDLECTEMTVLWFQIEKIALKFGFEKSGIFNKIPFLHKAFHGDFWKRLTSF